MVYGYIRVSTDHQDLENQKIGVVRKAAQLGICIDRFIADDGVSGAMGPDKRALGRLLRMIKPGDIVICSELSRLGRKMFMIMGVLEHLIRVGAKLYSVKDNYELGDNIQSKVLAFAFGIAAEIERDLISQRTREALARRKMAGMRLGRRPGSRNLHHKLDGRGEYIARQLANGAKRYQIAKTLGVDVRTLRRFIGQNNQRQ